MRSRALPIRANRTTHDAAINDFTIIWATKRFRRQARISYMPAGEIYRISMAKRIVKLNPSYITHTFWSRIVIYSWCESLDKTVVYINDKKTLERRCLEGYIEGL